MRQIFTSLDRQFAAIKPQIEKLDSPVMRDIATKALSRISSETTRHSFEDDRVRAELVGFPSENVVKVERGQWRVETKYEMHALLQRKSDGHVIFSEAGIKTRARTGRDWRTELTGEEIKAIQTMADLEKIGVIDEVSKWADSEHTASQVGSDRIKRGRVSLDQNKVWGDVLKKIDRRQNMLIRPDSKNHLLSFTRRRPIASYGLTDEELREVEHIPGGHRVSFEFEAMSDSDKKDVDKAVCDLVSNLFHEDFEKIAQLKSQWLSERMKQVAPEHALPADELGNLDLAVANFIVGGHTSENIRNRLQFAEMLNFESQLIEDALREPKVLSDIDSGRSMREIFAERLGYRSFSKKEFSVLKEYVTYKGPFRHGMLLEDAAVIAKLPAEYRPEAENFMLSLGNDFTHLNQHEAKKSIHNAVCLLESGAKRDALQSISWIKGGDWVNAMKKMENYPQAANLGDYFKMLEQLMSPAFAYLQYQEDPESIEVDHGDMRATYEKPASVSDRTLRNLVRESLASFPSLLVMNDKLHKNFNAITTKYREMGQYSPALITWTPLFSAPQKINEVTFVPLSTGSDIIAEGSEMKHCVASYLQAAMAGETFIVSVQKNNEKIATLELVQGDEDEWEVSQLYGPGNSIVTADIEDAAFDLLDKISEGEINCEPDTGMREELAEMENIKACALVEGYDFTDRNVAIGLLKEAIDYLPKGVHLYDLFLNLEKEWAGVLEELLAEDQQKTEDRVNSPELMAS